MSKLISKEAWHGLWHSSTPRPFVVIAATDRRQATYLYRAQNIIWVWLGLAAVLSVVEYVFRPHLGIVVTTDSHILDISREVLFAVGGTLIATGVWFVHRPIEVLGHVGFATGAVLNTFAVLLVHGIPPGAHIVSATTLLGIAFASGFRAYFIIKWIGADVYVHQHPSNSSN